VLGGVVEEEVALRPARAGVEGRAEKVGHAARDGPGGEGHDDGGQSHGSVSRDTRRREK
jgi:hypothetical protein